MCVCMCVFILISIYNDLKGHMDVSLLTSILVFAGPNPVTLNALLFPQHAGHFMSLAILFPETGTHLNTLLLPPDSPFLSAMT